MVYKVKYLQGPTMPYIDLTKLKSMTEEDWAEIVYRIPFMGGYRDYSDGVNLRVGSPVFRERTFVSAKQSGMSMLRTLNFSQKPESKMKKP